MYIHYIYNHRFKGGMYPKCKLRFLRCFWGGLENVSLHFEGILKTLPTKTTPGGHSAINFTFKGGSQKMYLIFWYGPPWKVALKRWWLYIYMYYEYMIYIYIYILYCMIHGDTLHQYGSPTLIDTNSKFWCVTMGQSVCHPGEVTPK